LEELDPPLPPEEDELVGDPEDESLDELPDESPEEESLDELPDESPEEESLDELDEDESADAFFL